LRLIDGEVADHRRHKHDGDPQSGKRLTPGASPGTKQYAICPPLCVKTATIRHRTAEGNQVC
jgi:hypothetical protein